MNTAVNPSWWLKLGDNLPPLQRISTLPNGAVINLTATTLAFRWQLVDNDGVPLSTAIPESHVADIIDAANGLWQYDWAIGAPAVAGVYAAELRITFGGGAGTLTLPENGWWYFEVIADLA